MAAIAHASAIQTTLQTHSDDGNYADVSGAQLASSNFVAGQKYLLLVFGSVGTNIATKASGMRVTHGSTAFADSEQLILATGSTSHFERYFWFDVWTAVSGEAITLQHKVNGGAAGDNVTADQCVLMAIRLDADLTENTDWFFNQVSTDTGLTTTLVDFASVTWTPGNANDRWLMLWLGQADSGSVTTAHRFQGFLDGVGSKGNTIQEGEDSAVDIFLSGSAWAEQLTAASHTWSIRGGTSSGTSHTHLHSKVFALNLSKFQTSAHVVTEATLDATVGTYTDTPQTLSFSPTTAGDCVVLVSDTDLPTSTSIYFHHRLQIDNADAPASQSTDSYQYSQWLAYDAADLVSFSIGTMANLTAASHTIDHDGDVETAAAGRGYADRVIVAFSMELASTPKSNLPIFANPIMRHIMAGN